MTFKRCFLLPLLLMGMLAPAAFGQRLAGAACPLSAIITDDTSSGNLQMVAIPTGITNPYIYINGVKTANPLSPQIHVCSIRAVLIQPGTPANYGFVYGTGTNCATGATNVTPQWLGTASVTEHYDSYWTDQTALVLPPATALCWKLSAAVTHSQVLITYGIN